MRNCVAAFLISKSAGKSPQQLHVAGSLTTRPVSRLSMRLVSLARVQRCAFVLPVPFPMLHGQLNQNSVLDR